MNLNKDTILTELNKINDYSIPNESYSPFYSNIGLVIKEETEGAGTLFLHYNRNTRAVWQSLIDFPLKLNREKSLVNLLVFGDCDRTAQLAFFDTDAFLFEAKGMENIGLFRTPDATVLDHWTEDFSKKEVLVRGLSRNGDDRDPDTTVPFAVSIKMLKGSLIAEQGNITAKADENGTTRFAFVFKVLDVSADDMAGTMKKAPTDVNVAAEMCKEDILSCVKDLNIPHTSDPEREMIARALHGLLFNLAKAPGNLREHISSYPNRGRYPTHYLWDSCFQNLAYEEFSTELAEEFLMQLIKNQRSDGKIIHFLCSTALNRSFFQKGYSLLLSRPQRWFLRICKT